MDFNFAQRSADPNQDSHPSRVGSSRNTICDPAPLFYSTSDSNCLSSFTPDSPQTFTASSPQNFNPTQLYSPEYSPEYSPTIYSPYFTRYTDNYIITQPPPAISAQHASISANYQHPPAISTPPTTPHTLGQHKRCRPAIPTPTHPHPHPQPCSPAAAPTAAKATGPAPMDEIGIGIRSVNLNGIVGDPNNRVWNDQFDNGFEGHVIAAAPL